MSFVSFLGQVGKIAFGYGGALVLLLVAIGAFMQDNTSLGAVLIILAIVLGLFGVYSEREL